ncbi:RnfABCDGE type electron transport complex subunit D, partial [Vibrio parahaemolyticus]|uniref:RnfABCDGE type electron transport complex subunit D n=1 Tax=Vibrio parahaemolyticus TaxID=670 RepID=UPI00146C3390
ASLIPDHVTFADTLSLIFTGYDYDGLSLQQVRSGVDGVTMATPLDAFKTGILTGATPSEVMSQPIFDGLGGIGWQWVNLAYLLGGIVMIKKRIIQWYIPAGFLASLTLFSLVFTLLTPG